MKIATSVLLSICLAGCTLGITEGDSAVKTLTFDVPANYQATYRLADQFARTCHQTAKGGGFSTSYDVAGNLYTDKPIGEIHVTMPKRGTDMEHVVIEGVGDAQSRVTARVWGRGVIWDEAELEALRDSLTSGRVACRG